MEQRRVVSPRQPGRGLRQDQKQEGGDGMDKAHLKVFRKHRLPGTFARSRMRRL
jgi:hypothetical protein